MAKLEITKSVKFSDLMNAELKDLFTFLKENLTEDENQTLDDVAGSYVAESGLVHEFIASFIFNYFGREMSLNDSIGSAFREWDL